MIKSTSVFQVVLVTFILVNLTFSQPKSEVEFFDSTGTTSTAKFGWRGSAEEGSFYIDTPEDSVGLQLKKGDLSVGGAVNAKTFAGDGSGLTNLPSPAETDPTVDASVKDGVSWDEVTGKPGTVGDITGVTAGTGLTGGGTSGSPTLNVDFGTTSGKAAEGNHDHDGKYSNGIDYYFPNQYIGYKLSFSTSGAYISVTVNAPTNGYVILMGTFNVAFTSDAVAFGLITDKTSKNEDENYYYLNGKASERRLFAQTKAFPVTTGNNTFRMYVWSSVGSHDAWAPILTAYFSPNKL